MLPALCFVFSEKMLKKCSTNNVNLFDEGSNQPSIIKKECMNILRKNFPIMKNILSYLNLSLLFVY